jgi:hypothetical protein
MTIPMAREPRRRNRVPPRMPPMAGRVKPPVWSRWESWWGFTGGILGVWVCDWRDGVGEEGSGDEVGGAVEVEIVVEVEVSEDVSEGLVVKDAVRGSAGTHLPYPVPPLFSSGRIAVSSGPQHRYPLSDVE